MQAAPQEAPQEEPTEQTAVEEEQTDELQDKDMDAVYATMLAHVMLAASSGFGMLIWSFLSDDADDLVAVAFAAYFMFAMIFSFLIAMILGSNFESLQTNLLSGSFGNVIGALGGMLILIVFMTGVDGLDFGDMMETYFKDMFLGMSITVGLTGLSGAYVGGLGRTTALPSMPEKDPQKELMKQQMLMQQQMMMQQQQQMMMGQQPMMGQQQQPMMGQSPAPAPAPAPAAPPASAPAPAAPPASAPAPAAPPAPTAPPDQAPEWP